MKLGSKLAGVLTLGWLVCGAGAAQAAVTVTDENMADVLQQILERKPELLLNFLRLHSEDVLDIAQEGSNVKRTRLLKEQWQNEVNDTKKVDLSNRPVRGSAKAPVHIIAYSDFTCAYCYRAFKVMNLLLKQYEGKVNLIFKHAPLQKGDIAYRASEYFIAASMQSKDKAWRLHDTFFDKRDTLLAEGEAFLKREAKAAGLDMKKLDADLAGKDVTKILEDDLAEGKALGIQGTPFFLVNNLTVRGALPPELFEEAIKIALKNARR